MANKKIIFGLSLLRRVSCLWKIPDDFDDLSFAKVEMTNDLNITHVSTTVGLSCDSSPKWIQHLWLNHKTTVLFDCVIFTKDQCSLKPSHLKWHLMANTCCGFVVFLARTSVSSQNHCLVRPLWYHVRWYWLCYQSYRLGAKSREK